MSTMWFYIVALVLMVLGGILIRNTSPYSRSGGAQYEKKRKRKLIGMTLIFMAIVLAMLGVIAQFLTSSP